MAERPVWTECYALPDLERNYGVEASDLKKWLLRGDLIAHAWWPVMSVFKMEPLIEGVQVNLSWRLCHWEGFMPISKHCYHRLMKQGRIYLREFNGVEAGEVYRLPETADDLALDIGDLLVLKSDWAKFEEIHLSVEGLTKPIPANQAIQRRSHIHGDHAIDSEFKIIRLNGQDFRFGDMQANILRLLWESAKNGRPWQSGKQLLKEAGSQSFSLSNVFKRNRVWRNLVQSDGRGLYRLHPDWIRMKPRR